MISSQANPLPDLIFSSQFEAIGNDALKDIDNLRWLDHVDLHFHRDWICRIRWVRWVDRAAEEEMLNRRSQTFSTFLAQWKHDPTSNKTIRHDLRSAPPGVWDEYIQGCGHYHLNLVEMKTFADYLIRASRLSGSIFQLFPFVESAQLESFRQLGVLDQIYNDLRDLHEDIALNQCPFPREILQRENIAKAVIEDYIPELKITFDRKSLHPTLRLMIQSCEERYARIERVYRECDYDIGRFHNSYWSEIRNL